MIIRLDSRFHRPPNTIYYAAGDAVMPTISFGPAPIMFNFPSIARLHSVMTKRLGETAEILLHFYNTPVIIPGDNTVYVQPDIFLEKYAGCANLTFDKEPFYEDVTRQNIILGHTIGIGFEAANGFQPCSDELFELALFLEPLA